MVISNIPTNDNDLDDNSRKRLSRVLLDAALDSGGHGLVVV